jgi:hypothetical protein
MTGPYFLGFRQSDSGLHGEIPKEKWILGSFIFFLIHATLHKDKKKFWSTPCIMGSKAYRFDVSPALGVRWGFACDLHRP